MDKREFFIKALNAGAARKRHWVFSVFSVTEDPDSDPTTTVGKYPYQVVRKDNLTYFVTEGGEFELISGVGKSSIAEFREQLIIDSGDIANYTGSKPLVTTYGNALINHLLLAEPFGTKIPYQEGHFSIKRVEAEILSRLIDDPEDEMDDTPAPDGKIYVREYLEFTDAALSIVGLNNIAVTSSSQRSVQTHPDMRKRRKELMEQFKGKLDDPAVIAKIGEVLEALDREWIKGDPSEDFFAYNDKKYYGSVRKKMYAMFGAESPFQDGTVVEFIAKSLEEGIDIEHLPAMINSLRYGSYNRGEQTKLGGESTKTIYRMLGTVRISEDDCGAKVGMPTPILDENKDRYLGRYYLDGGKLTPITKDNLPSLVNTIILLRGPLSCKTEGRNICAVCAGDQLAEQPNGLAAAAAGLGGRYLSIFLAAMHAKELTTKKWDLSERLT